MAGREGFLLVDFVPSLLTDSCRGCRCEALLDGRVPESPTLLPEVDPDDEYPLLRPDVPPLPEELPPPDVLPLPEDEPPLDRWPVG